jgi:Bacterial Ig-like domain
MSFSPDSGTVGDGITNATVLTLAGTAEAGSTVKVFDGGSQFGTATANASGAWNFTTPQLSNATHNFTAMATNAAGNTSSASSLLTVKVDAARTSPSSPTPNGENLLVMGSFGAMSVERASGRALAARPQQSGSCGTIRLFY